MESFPVGALRDNWTWRELLSREPLLVHIKERVQRLLENRAQRTRDLNRAQRLEEHDYELCCKVTWAAIAPAMFQESLWETEVQYLQENHNSGSERWSPHMIAMLIPSW